jgi:hypothetical protein
MNDKINYISSQDPCTRLFEWYRPGVQMNPSHFDPPAEGVPMDLTRFFLSYRPSYSLVHRLLETYRPFCASSIGLLSASGRGADPFSPPAVLLWVKLHSPVSVTPDAVTNGGRNSYLCPITGSALSRLLLRDCCSSRGRGRLYGPPRPRNGLVPIWNIRPTPKRARVYQLDGRSHIPVQTSQCEYLPLVLSPVAASSFPSSVAATHARSGPHSNITEKGRKSAHLVDIFMVFGRGRETSKAAWDALRAIVKLGDDRARGNGNASTAILSLSSAGPPAQSMVLCR